MPMIKETGDSVACFKFGEGCALCTHAHPPQETEKGPSLSTKANPSTTNTRHVTREGITPQCPIRGFYQQSISRRRSL